MIIPISQNQNNRKMPFVCLVRSDNDMGHLECIVNWEENRKPLDAIEIEKRIRSYFYEIAFRYMEAYGKTRKVDDRIIATMHFRPKDPQNSIHRCVVDDRVYCKISFLSE